MLETQTNLIVAGLLVVDGEVSPIFVDVNNGDCVFELPSVGTPQLIAEVSVDNPMEITDVRAMEKSLSSAGNDFKGIIFRTDGTAIVILDENTAVIRKIDCLGSGGDTFGIDLNCDYDVDEEED